MSTYHYMFTYGGPQLFMMVVWFIATPIFYRKLLKPHSMKVRVFSVLWLWMAAIVVAYGDVYLIAREAKRLCSEEAGMNIYRTASAEGMFGLLGANYWKKYGFKYIEKEALSGGQFIRTRLTDDEYYGEPVSELISKYEYSARNKTITSSIMEQREIISERSNGSILGEVIAFSFYPGWLDRKLLGSLGLSWSPPRCDDDFIPKQGASRHLLTEFVSEVIQPE